MHVYIYSTFATRKSCIEVGLQCRTLQYKLFCSKPLCLKLLWIMRCSYRNWTNQLNIELYSNIPTVWMYSSTDFHFLHFPRILPASKRLGAAMLDHRRVSEQHEQSKTCSKQQKFWLSIAVWLDLTQSKDLPIYTSFERDHQHTITRPN